MTTIEFEGATYDLADFKHPGGSIIRSAYLKDATMLVHSYHPDVDRVRKAIASYKLDKTGDTTKTKVSYEGPLYNDLKKRVHSALKQNNQSPGADNLLRFKMIVFVLHYILSIVWVAISESSFSTAMAALSLGTGTAMVGMNVAHDASHMATESGSSVWLNYVWQLISSELIGLSTLGWRHEHVIQHHILTQSKGDPDVEVTYPILRSTEYQPHLPHHYFQCLLLFPLMFGLTFIFQLHETVHILTGLSAVDGIKKPTGLKHTTQDWLQFALSKVGAGLQLMLLYHKGGFTACLLYYAAGGYILAAIDIPGHQTIHPPLPKKLPPSMMGGDVVDSWLLAQLRNTNSFDPHSNWLLGGLNMQIEHHLFPRLSHRHYPYLIRPILQEFCKEHGLPYNDYTLIGATLATLKYQSSKGKRINQRCTGSSMEVDSCLIDIILSLAEFVYSVISSAVFTISGYLR